MNNYADFKEWLSAVRYSRNVSMLIPMEACMGYPVAVKQGEEFILPFFRALSTKNMDRLSPPFCYIRISYPSGMILTYNNLRTLPDWEDVDWNSTLDNTDSGERTPKLDKYYKALVGGSCEPPDDEQLDGLLLCSLSQPLSEWYEKLIAEAKKYR